MSVLKAELENGQQPPQGSQVSAGSSAATVSGLAVKAWGGRKCWNCGKKCMGCACSLLTPMGLAELGSCPCCDDMHFAGSLYMPVFKESEKSKFCSFSVTFQLLLTTGKQAGG